VSATESGTNPYVYLCYDVVNSLSLITNSVDLPYNYTIEEYNNLVNNHTFTVSIFDTSDLVFDNINDLTQLISLLTKNKKK
jgi:hypothetical protein